MERTIGLGSRHIFGDREVVEGEVGDFSIIRLDKKTKPIPGTESFVTNDYLLVSGIACLLESAFAAQIAPGRIGFLVGNLCYAEMISNYKRSCELYSLDSEGQKQEPVVVRSQEELVVGLQNLLKGSGLDAS